MNEYLSTKELAGRIKMAPGTIRNLVWKKRFKENIHYLKPTPRKLLFIWAEIEAWLRGDDTGASRKDNQEHRSLINI